MLMYVNVLLECIQTHTNVRINVSLSLVFYKQEHFYQRIKLISSCFPPICTELHTKMIVFQPAGTQEPTVHLSLVWRIGVTLVN